MKIFGDVEKDKETGINKILVELNADDTKILDQAIRAFDKFDEDDFEHRAKIEDLKEQLHKVWALTHPS